ncbi:MAG: winged helix DNA-binding protein [Alphaproteobacteria bacterium]
MAANHESGKFKDIGPIISSAHLAKGAMPELSEVEFALILAQHAFSRWSGRCMAAAGQADLSPLDVLVLHNVNHRARIKTLADICLVLNVEDTHTVSYAVKKLEKRGLVKSSRSGKEKMVEITPRGEEACLTYADIREACLVRAVKSLGIDAGDLSTLATLLRTLSGHYDQAARAAASL